MSTLVCIESVEGVGVALGLRYLRPLRCRIVLSWRRPCKAILTHKSEPYHLFTDKFLVKLNPPALRHRGGGRWRPARLPFDVEAVDHHAAWLVVAETLHAR